MFSPVKPVNRQHCKPDGEQSRKRWSVLMDRYTKRVLWFEKGMRLGLLTSEFASVALIGEPPAAMTRENCREYVVTNNGVVHRPEPCVRTSLKSLH